MSRLQSVTVGYSRLQSVGCSYTPHPDATTNHHRPTTNAANPMTNHRAGMDDADGVEGFMAEKAGVAKRRAADLLGGVPYRLSGSAQATKDQVRLACVFGVC